jgi:hypothetical protein
VYSLDYLSSKYELRLGGKNLNELSPGEKGLLLLVFYLQLDKNNIPLVIDQPEDNLDNDSIFKVLAECIRRAKKTRQVILVTHNPNLAVGADAEQIVFVKLEKAVNYKFSYESGSIENPKLNRRIVDVLEGSQPAFVKRRLKWDLIWPISATRRLSTETRHVRLPQPAMIMPWLSIPCILRGVEVGDDGDFASY